MLGILRYNNPMSALKPVSIFQYNCVFFPDSQKLALMKKNHGQNEGQHSSEGPNPFHSHLQLTPFNHEFTSISHQRYLGLIKKGITALTNFLEKNPADAPILLSHLLNDPSV